VGVGDYVSDYVISKKGNFLMKNPLIWGSKIAFLGNLIVIM